MIGMFDRLLELIAYAPGIGSVAASAYRWFVHYTALTSELVGLDHAVDGAPVPHHALCTLLSIQHRALSVEVLVEVLFVRRRRAFRWLVEAEGLLSILLQLILYAHEHIQGIAIHRTLGLGSRRNRRRLRELVFCVADILTSLLA